MTKSRKHDQANALFVLYCAHHDSICLFDKRRSAVNLAAIELLANSLGVTMKDLHENWLLHRRHICSALGVKISHPAESLAEVEL